MSGSVSVLKKPGGGKNTHSIFDGFSSVPICISSPNREKLLVRRVVPFFSVSPGFKDKCAIVYIEHAE